MLPTLQPRDQIDCQFDGTQALYFDLTVYVHMVLNAPNIICFQAMDSSHVSLVTVKIPRETFEEFRCDRNLSLGLNLGVVTKVIKTANNDDVLTLKVMWLICDFAYM